MRTFEITTEHLATSHPDHMMLRVWFADNGIDDSLIGAGPVKVAAGFIEVVLPLRIADGSYLRTADGKEIRTARVRYELTPTALPNFRETKVTDV